MAKGINKIVVVDGSNMKPIASFWWDGKKVKTDDEKMFDQLKDEGYPYKSSDGIKFLNGLLSHYKNGYVHAYRIGDSLEDE